MEQKYYIFVVESGWVFSGMVESETEQVLNVTDAKVIAVWGTNRGLGQLAKSGPTKETKLEPCMFVEIQKSKLLFRIPCEVAL